MNNSYLVSARSILLFGAAVALAAAAQTSAVITWLFTRS